MAVGFVFNLASSNKDDKNLLTVIPYVKWSNVLKIEKDPAMGKEINLKDLFSVGLTLGIPINIGK